MKITRRQLRRIIRESLNDRQDGWHAEHGYLGQKIEVDPMDSWVDEYIADFIDIYIQTASSPKMFWDRWEYHCEEEGISCTQDELSALVQRAEEMGEVEEGELFVGERGAW